MSYLSEKYLIGERWGTFVQKKNSFGPKSVTYYNIFFFTVLMIY